MTGSNPSVTDYILEVPGRTTQRCASRHSGQLAIDLRHVRSRSQKRILEICFNHGVRHQYRNVPLATAVVLVRAADHSIASLYHRPQIPQYKVVDHVWWTRAVARRSLKMPRGALPLSSTTIWGRGSHAIHVEFDFGTFTLYGGQLETPVRTKPTN